MNDELTTIVCGDFNFDNTQTELKDVCTQAGFTDVIE